MVQRVAVLCLLLTACRPNTPGSQTAHEQTSSGVDANPVAGAAVSPDTGRRTHRIRITGPTVIMAVGRRLTQDAARSEEANEALSDFMFYFGQAARFLEDRGVRSIVESADTLVIEQDNQDTTIPIDAEPLYYVTTPGKRPVRLGHRDTERELVSLAVNYFWEGKVPLGRGDTLTPATATADFVITRPTIIGYFSRRSLDIRYRGHGPSPANYPDSSLLVNGLHIIKDSLERAGIDVEIALRNRFTVLVRGQIDSISLSGMGRILGYYLASPDNWRIRYIDSYRPTTELIQHLRSYLDGSEAPVRPRASPPR